MKTNINQRKVKIISEIHPQHFGSMSEIKRMIMQCKIAGCDYVKVQLYNSEKLFKNNDRIYLDINRKEFEEIKTFSDNLGIEIFAEPNKSISVALEAVLKILEDIKFILGDPIKPATNKFDGFL